MLAAFENLDTRWFHRAFVYTGSVTDRTHGIDFRYRFVQDISDKAAPKIMVFTYADTCFEKAENIAQASFPWTDEGVASLRLFLQSQYEKLLDTKRTQ